MDQQMEKTGTKPPEVLREELPLQRLIGEGLSQAVVEGEVALPGGLREETHVLLSQAMAALDKSTVENGRVNAEGKVTFHVLYTQGDPTKVSALEASAEFSHPIELAGAQSGMQAPISMMVEHVEASAQGGRLHLMAILRVHARVLTDEPVSVVTGVQGVDGLMLRTETVRVLRPACQGAQDVLIRDKCELPAALQIDVVGITAQGILSVQCHTNGITMGIKIGKFHALHLKMRSPDTLCGSMPGCARCHCRPRLHQTAPDSPVLSPSDKKLPFSAVSLAWRGSHTPAADRSAGWCAF